MGWGNSRLSYKTGVITEVIIIVRGDGVAFCGRAVI